MSINRSSEYQANLAGGSLVVPAISGGDVPHAEADTHVDQGTRDLTTTPARILMGSVELPAQVILRIMDNVSSLLFAVTNSATPPAISGLTQFVGPGQEASFGMREGLYLHCACTGAATAQAQMWSHDYSPTGV